MSVGDDKALMQWQLELELQEEVRSRKMEPLDLKPEEAIVITHYGSPTKFRYIMLQELEANGRIVNHIEWQLAAHCHADNLRRSYDNLGYVILRYQPCKLERYLRGQVVYFNRSGNSYIVQTLDYGFFIHCHVKDLWHLPQHLRQSHIEIKDGGLAGVTSFSGTDWSQKEIHMLDQKLEEAVLLIFRIRYKNYGQLLIKSPRGNEPLLNAASFLIESQCARLDLKYMTHVHPEALSAMENVEINEANITPSARVATIMRLMELQRIKLPSYVPNPKENRQQFKQNIVSKKDVYQLNARMRNLTLPSAQQQRLGNLLREHRAPTIPNSAKRLSMVRDRKEGTVERALINSSSSLSSSGSSCSSDSLNTVEFFKKTSSINRRSSLDVSMQPKINQRPPVQLNESLQREMVKIEEDPQEKLLVEQKPANGTSKVQRLLSDIHSLVWGKPTTNLKLQDKEIPKILEENAVKKGKGQSVQLKAEDVLKAQSNDKFDRIINEMSDLANPVKKATNQAIQLKSKTVLELQDNEVPKILSVNAVKNGNGQVSQLKAENVFKAQDKDKFDRIINEMSDLENPFGKLKLQSFKLKPQDREVQKKSTVKPISSTLDKVKLEQSLRKDRVDTKAITKVPKERLLLAHSKEQVSPINGVPEKLFNEDIWIAMGEMNYQTPLPMQRYAWPHLMRGNTLLLIDGNDMGRSWSYLPMLCSLVMSGMQRTATRIKDAPSLGPLAVILADSIENARVLTNHCSNLMKSYDKQSLKLVNTHDHSMQDVQLMLLNSCGILITTVSHMKLLFQESELNLIDPQRLKYFIVDDYDHMFSVVPESLNESLQLLQSLAHPQLQLILIAQQWHGRVFLQLIKRFNHNPLLLFGDFLEAAIYGNLKIDVALQHSSKKTQQLIDYLAKLAKASLSRRTVIYCRTKAELVDLQQALTAAGHACIGLSDAAHQQIHKLLLVTDAVDGMQQPTLLPIRNFELLVHYSLPDTWLQFSYRFHAIIDNIDNCLLTEEKHKDIASYVMLDENSSCELPRLAQFLHAHDVKLDEHINQMVASCRKVTDQNRAFCPQMLSRGECGQTTCNKRHFTIDGDFQRSHCALWQPDTVVRCKLIKVYNPVHFAIMTESYRSSDCDSWQATLGLSKLRKLCTSLCVHMSLDENRRPQQKLHIFEICVIARGMRYQRVRVVDLSDQCLVSVQLLDEGTELLKVKPVELFECDARFKEVAPLAMDVRLCGLMPSSIGEGHWLPEATKWVSEELSGLRDNQHLQLIVEFAMLNTVYVREITLMQECPTMRTWVKAMQLHNELVRREFGQQEEQSIKRLRLMHQEIKDQQQQIIFKDDIVQKDIKSAKKEDPWDELEKSVEEMCLTHQKKKEELPLSTSCEDMNIEETLEESSEKILLKEKVGDEFVNVPQNKDNLKDEFVFEKKNEDETLQFSGNGKLSPFLGADQLGSVLRETKDVEVKEDNVQEDNGQLKTTDAKGEPSSLIKLESTGTFLDILQKDFQSSDPLINDSAKKIIQEILADDSPRASMTIKRKMPNTRQQISPVTMSKALNCACIEGNVVRPKVRWHQTLMQIELIFEQQVPQYEIIHQGNVLIYQVLETTPPQRCILNLLGEVMILSEQQHGYQLHVKLAKHNLIFHWPTLLSSLSAQQHCHWLVYDTDRGKSPQPEMGRVIWLRYMRGLCPSNLADDEGSKFSSDDELSLSDKD